MSTWARNMQVGPYILVSPLGEGGMGEVWMARDERLRRTVAIKRIKTHYTARFEQEARAIAALNHPNICQIHDVGPDYLVLEYIDGQPLRGPLPIDQALRVGIQVADALDEAHSKDILHCDLKPGNILITTKGVVKLLDFGLAKLLDVDSEVTRTMDGELSGTAAYMSPEQTEGRVADARSDLFSFGAVFYELLAGRRAFEGERITQVLNAVLHTEPQPLQVPIALDRIVRRCLAKQPSERFQSAAELKKALEQFSAPPTSASIAVLPFANMSGKPDDEFFSDGLAEEIINTLAHVPGLKVTARTSAFAFRGKEQDIRRIAETLGVRTILEGSIRRAGVRIRVTAQLINSEDGYHLWSERYDRQLDDVFAIQDEIAQAITTALQVKLVPKSANAQHRPPDLAAYEAFLKGRHYLFQGSPDALDRAKRYFEQAIALDPEFAAAHAELGMYHWITGVLGMCPLEEILPMVRSEARNASGISASDPRVRILLGIVSAGLDCDWKEADRQFRLAIADEPLPPEVRARYAYGALNSRGRYHEAIRELEAALEQDPLNPIIRSLLAGSLSAAGMHERAIALLQKTLDFGDHYLAYTMLAQSYVCMGAFSEAQGPAEKAYQLVPTSPIAIGLLAGIYVRVGKDDRAGALGADMTPNARVVYHTTLLEIAAAAEWFKRAIEQHEFMSILGLCPALLNRLRTSDYWPELANTLKLPNPN